MYHSDFQVLSVIAGVPSWVDSGGVGTNYWQRNSGTVAPINIGDDLLVGGISTASAKISLNATSGLLTTTLFKLTTSPAAGYALISDASGNGSWTDMATSGTAGPWTLSGSVTFPDTATYNVLIGSATAGDGISPLTVSGAETGKALVILNETGDQNILAASASGVTKFVLDRNGIITTASVNSASIVDASVAATDLANTAVTAAAYGSSGVTVPTFTVDAQGRLTTASSYTISGLTTSNLSATAGILNAQLANSAVTVTAGTGLSGGGAVSLGSSVTLTNAGVTSAVGTTNQVNVSASTGAVTFSLPQSIATNSNVTFNNLSLGGNATVSGGLVLYGTPTISTTAMQSLTLGDSNTGNINLPSLTASRAVFTDAASNLVSTAASAALLNSLSDETGTGVAVFATSPTLVTPVLGVATATSINKVTLTTPATGSTLTIADGKTFTSSNTLTLTGTDGSSLNIGTGGTLGTGAYATIANYQTLLTNSAGLLAALNDETGSGLAVFATTPTLVTPVLGVATATSINKVTLTTPATGSTLTVPDGSTVTFQGTDTYVGRATTDTLTNKTWNGVAIGPTYGGTNQTTYTTGDILYASATDTLAKLGIGSTSQVLTVSGGIPSWGAGASSSNWQRNSGAIAPLNITDDLLVGGISTASAKLSVISGSGNLTTAGTITLPNSNTLTGVSGYTQFGAGISVGGGTTYYINTSGVANLAGTTVSALTNSGATILTGALTAQSTASISGALTLYGTPTIGTTALQSLTLGNTSTGNILLSPGSATPSFVVTTAGQVGIGTTGPTAKLDVNGTSIFRDTLSMTNAAIGGVSRLSFNSGSYIEQNNPVNYSLGFATGSTPAINMVIRESGNVGIGTTNPGYKLSIVGASGTTQLFLNDGSTGGATLTSAAASGLTFLAGARYQSAYYALSTIASGVNMYNGNISFQSDTGLTAGNVYTPTTRMYISNAGNVGIGTTSPLAKLDVNGTASISGALSLYGSPVIASTAKQSLTLGDANTGNIFLSPGSATPSFVVTTAGQVGIGTTGPGALLEVYKSQNTTTGVTINNPSAGDYSTAELYLASSGGTGILRAMGGSYTAGGTLAHYQDSLILDSGALAGGVQLIAGDANGLIRFYSGGTAVANERMRITSAGNVGIGTTAPLALLDVAGTASVSGAMKLYGTPTVQSTANKTLILGGDTTGWINFAPLNTDTLTIKPNLLALGTATIDGTGTLSLNTTNNQAITTGTGTFTVAGAATVSASLAFGPQSTDVDTCNAANEGRVYYKGTTGTKRLYLCDGTTWIPISAGTLTGGSSIDTLSPEYPNAVISADGSNNVGTFTSDREATGSGSLYYFNYYEFTSAQTSLQDYDIYVRYRIPENFSSWTTSNALTVDFETEDTTNTNNKIDVTIYQDNDADTVTSLTNVSSYANTWHSAQTGGTPVNFTAAQLNTGLTWSAGSMMTIKIKLYSKDNYFARVGAIKFDWQ